MNSKASLKGTGWIQLKKEYYLDYSRHLSARTRSAALNITGGQSFARAPQVYHVKETLNTAVKAVNAAKRSIGHRQKA